MKDTCVFINKIEILFSSIFKVSSRVYNIKLDINMLDCDFWSRYIRVILYMWTFIFFRFLNSVIYCAQSNGKRVQLFLFFSLASVIQLLISHFLKEPTIRWFPLRPYFHGRRRVAHRSLASFLREKTDFQERYLWHSRNEMHAASPRKRSGPRASRPHRKLTLDEIAPLRCTEIRIRKAKSSRNVYPMFKCSSVFWSVLKIISKFFSLHAAVFFVISVCIERPINNINSLHVQKESVMYFTIIKFLR